jgi:hypothetical protein
MLFCLTLGAGVEGGGRAKQGRRAKQGGRVGFSAQVEVCSAHTGAHQSATLFANT